MVWTSAEPAGPPAAGASLARRLRELRRSGFFDVGLTQLQLAQALSQDERVADSTLLFWRMSNRLPCLHTAASAPTHSSSQQSARCTGRPTCAARAADSGPETKARKELERELFKLRDEDVGGIAARRRFWRFDDEAPITVICSDLRKSDELELGPLTEEDNPNYAELYSYGDLDALFDRTVIYAGQIRTNDVYLRRGATTTWSTTWW